MSLQPVKTTTYLTDTNNRQHYIPANCSFTLGQSWATKERRATDSTRTIHNISILTKRGRQPATIQMSFIVSAAVSDDGIFDALSEYESLIGQNVSVVYAENDIGRYIIENGTFSLSTDYAMGAVSLVVNYNLKESIIYVPDKNAGKVRFE